MDDEEGMTPCAVRWMVQVFGGRIVGSSLLQKRLTYHPSQKMQ